MNRLLVALLAALDAVLAAAGGLAVSLAPLTLLWVFAFSGGADWNVLWSASAVVWQFGHLVPVSVHLPGDYLAAAGIDPGAADFVLSLAPLGFAVFTALFAARSGGRAAQAGEAITGAVTGSLVFAGITALVASTGGAPLAAVSTGQAVLLPALVFAVPCLLGASIGAWVFSSGAMGRVRARVEAARDGWGLVAGLIVRGTAIAVLGLVGAAALVLAVALLAGAGQIVALFQAGNVDAVGATVLTFVQALYLPTMIVWALAFVAGPGFAFGTDTAVSPAGTTLGVVPGIPVLGALPESTSSWLLLLTLLPVGVGVLAGWMLRSRFAAAYPRHEPYAPRVVVVAGVAVLAACIAAVFAVCASGAIGPGRLAHAGPEPGPVALAVGLEIGLGAAILLLSPRRAEASVAPAPVASDVPYIPVPPPVPSDVFAGDPFAPRTEPVPVDPFAHATEPVDPLAHATEPVDPLTHATEPVAVDPAPPHPGPEPETTPRRPAHTDPFALPPLPDVPRSPRSRSHDDGGQDRPDASVD